MQITELEIRDRIQTRLGQGMQCIELNESDESGESDQLQEAIYQALDLFNLYLHQEIRVGLENVATVQSYVDLSGDPLIQSITDVQFLRPNTVTSYGQLDVFGLTERALIARPWISGAGAGDHGYAAGRWSTSNLLELKMQQEAVERARGTEPDWLWDEANKYLSLYTPAGPYDIMYTMSYPHDIESLPNGMTVQFLKAAEGYARIMMGFNRAKYGSSTPGPLGDIQNDGQEQIRIGQELVNGVEEYISKLPIIPGMWHG